MIDRKAVIGKDDVASRLIQPQKLLFIRERLGLGVRMAGRKDREQQIGVVDAGRRVGKLRVSPLTRLIHLRRLAPVGGELPARPSGSSSQPGGCPSPPSSQPVLVSSSMRSLGRRQRERRRRLEG